MEFILYPLIHFYDWFFQSAYSLTSSYGLAIILLSIFVSIIMLPLLWLGDRILDRNAAQRQKMQAELDSLKDVPIALERYYYTRRIYQIYAYHPIQSLSNLLGLLIQIPFFLAAYFYLSHSEVLKEVPFWGILDLGQADGILHGINFLPLLMTAFNVLAAELYLLSHPRQNQRASRIQQYMIAILFLVLLYRLPAGLLLYWTCNNLFSLIKNIIVAKLRRKRAITQKKVKDYTIKLYRILTSNSNFLAITSTIIFLIIGRKFYHNIETQLSENFHYKLVFLLLDLMLFLYVLKYKNYLYHYLTITVAKLKFIELIILLSVFLSATLLSIFHFNQLMKIFGYQFELIPNIISLKISIILLLYTLLSMLILFYIRRKSTSLNLPREQNYLQSNGNQRVGLSFMNILVLPYIAVFYSALLAISSSPHEFSHPALLLLQLLAFTAAFSVLLALLKIFIKKQYRHIYNYILFTLIVYLLVNYYVFNTNNYGLMDRFILHNARVLEITKNKVLIDSIFLYIICFIFVKYRIYIIRYIAKISLVVFLILLVSSIYPLAKIINYSDQKIIINDEKLENKNDLNEKFFKFSQNGKNVLVVFFDRFIGGLVPDILEDVPELNEQLSGFTWFPNTVSPGTGTISGLPAIHGGYPFTLGSVNSPNTDTFIPTYKEWNEPDSESSQRIKKSTQFAIGKFLDAGWHTFINDPSYLNGKWYGDVELVRSWGANSYAENLINRGYDSSEFSKYTGLFSGIQIRETGNMAILKKLILPYGLFKIAPPSFRLKIYNEGRWNSLDSTSQGWIASYRKNLALARMYPHLSAAMNDQNNYYNFTTNIMTHDVYAARDNGKFVQWNAHGDDGDDWRKVQEGGISKESLQRFQNEYTAVHFFADKEALIQMGRWIDWLQQNDVYDNTMIIIVADHGRGGIANPMFAQQTSADGFDYSAYHPLLMVKGFEQNGPLQTDYEFMSTADVPSIVLESIEPGASAKYRIDKSAGLRLYAPQKESKFLVVKDNIFKPENWFYQ